ncbi:MULTISPECIES: anti-sigma factor domain-containing protein [Galbibacter]|uniref:Anti-sigma factor n=1 Tax=Galbibacter pacificus TaxID=2996052 RepID=A0ABT6FM03_9FLAO|nr:anti-sigma factor [Galbibacter pacificus]MDG3580819.1 anti-sigma factor [Galbibacter pacificus]MDG3584297.1 anti-sigma factor [Galbibacter pacificus]
MKNEVKIFLESDLLERYMLGEVSQEEEVRIEHFISKYPEVEQEYITLQENLELYAKAHAMQVPSNVKNEVMAQVKATKTVAASAPKKSVPWYFIAACVTTLLFGATTITLWKQNRLLSTEKNTVASQIENLKNDIVSTNAKLENIKSKYAVLNDPETRKYIIKGNERAKNLRSVAYVNPKEKLSAINVLSMPELPKDKELKMWAEINGEMVCLGVIEKADRKLMALPFKDNASNYKITIESKGNDNFASIDSEVANIKLTE